MVVTAVGLALMTTLQRDTRYWPQRAVLFIVGIGSGMFNCPNTAAMMGAVPSAPPRHRRRRRGCCVQNTGAVISIAFVLAIITAAVPKTVLFSDLLRAWRATSRLPSSTRSSPTCTWRCGRWPAISLLGAVVSLMRPSTSARAEDERRSGEYGMA